MLKCLVGYPLYDPKPFSELSKDYLHNGVNVGDVGFVRGNGTFDFLFNICPSRNGLINPSDLPFGFSLETSDLSGTRNLEPLPRDTCLFQSPVTKTSSGEYICEGSEGAILELPEGAIEDEATNLRPLEKLAARHGVQWYEYTMKRGRKVSNGSLYLITSFTKCAQWGIAVFDRSCTSGQGLKFDRKISLPFAKSNTKYHWKGSRAFSTKVSHLKQDDALNQCVFLRGYKIMIRQDIFDDLCNDKTNPHSSPSKPGNINMTRQRATRIRGGGGNDNLLKTPTLGGILSQVTTSTKAKSDKATLHPDFNLSLVHPSDFINDALLNQNPNAKVALTHDNVWCDLLRENFPKFGYTALINIAQLYTIRIDEYDCVSVQKNGPDENSFQFQGTKVLAIQGLHATTEDDFPHVPSKNSLNLPHELVERIVLMLDTNSMLKCRLVNREFNEIIQSSVLLQYFLGCKAAGVIDNPQSKLSYCERLEALKQREDAWKTLKPVFETTIKVNHQSRNTYCLTGGTFFLDDNNQKDLHYCRLPSSLQDHPQWNRFPCHGPGEGWPGVFVNFAISVYEHDLIINIISTDAGNQTTMQERYTLELVLLKFSTGEYHPLAHQPRIPFQKTLEVETAAVLEVAGDNLVFIINSHNTFPDRLFIFDWKTGHKRLQHEAADNEYSDLVLVSSELLLVFNLTLSHFEVWYIPPYPSSCAPPIQILALKMLAVSTDYSLFDLSCRGEPSPFLRSLPHFPSRPFFSSPEHSIIITNIHFESVQGYKTPTYAFIMHRRTLLDTIRKWTSLERPADQLIWSTNEVTTNQIVGSDSELVKLGAQSKSISTTPRHRSCPPHRGFPGQEPLRGSTSYIPADPSSFSISSQSPRNSSTSQYDFSQVQWADWGPPISRWFKLNKKQSQWIMNSAGQRFAFSFPNPHDRKKLMVNIADFNQYNVRRNADMTGLSKSENGDNNNGEIEEGREQEELEKFDHEGVFAEEVYMGLKCVIYHAPDEHDFDGVVMDEERLLGVKLDDDGGEESIKVLYFG